MYRDGSNHSTKLLSNTFRWNDIAQLLLRISWSDFNRVLSLLPYTCTYYFHYIIQTACDNLKPREQPQFNYLFLQQPRGVSIASSSTVPHMINEQVHPWSRQTFRRFLKCLGWPQNFAFRPGRRTLSHGYNGCIFGRSGVLRNETSKMRTLIKIYALTYLITLTCRVGRNVNS